MHITISLPQQQSHDNKSKYAVFTLKTVNELIDLKLLFYITMIYYTKCYTSYTFDSNLFKANELCIE